MGHIVERGTTPHVVAYKIEADAVWHNVECNDLYSTENIEKPRLFL
jgi:hypothetical protein